MSLLVFEGVRKVFKSSVIGRYIYTLGPLDFEVNEGEIFGYLGPNGSGKTTTIKMVLGLLRQSTGKITCFGKPAASIDARMRIGFLPEQPYFYQHLTALELLEFYADIFGLPHKQKRRTADRLLAVTGLSEFRNTQLSKFSKGMLQRIGLAQALINDPDLIILDEPLSGLDPVGRCEIRDLILELKREGKTVFFSSHILQDVEMICDRVAILSQGSVLKVAKVADVLQESIQCVEITVDDLVVKKAMRLGVGTISRRGGKTVVTVDSGANVNSVINDLISAGGRISSVVPLRQTLEAYFMCQIRARERESEPKPVHSRSVLQGTR
jgi:ABC-2 type transport system ATP-binding protein